MSRVHRVLTDIPSSNFDMFDLVFTDMPTETVDNFYQRFKMSQPRAANLVNKDNNNNFISAKLDPGVQTSDHSIC